MNVNYGKGYDVAVVGAGPAGCAASLKAAKEGLSVILIERRTREAFMEPGHTSFEALQNLTQKEDALEVISRLGFDLEPAYPYTAGIVHGPFGSTFSMRLKRPHGHFMRRQGAGSLDHQMLGMVEKKGIEVLFDAMVEKAGRDGRLALSGGSGERLIKADVIIGADGRSTTIGRGIATALGKEDIAIGIGCHFKGSHGFEPGAAECWLGSRLSPGEYAYVLASRDEATVVTTMRPHLMDEGSRPNDYLDRFLSLPEVKQRTEGAEMVCKVHGCIPVRPGGPLGAGSVLLTGEAARLTEPLLGFGMKNAISSGYMAGMAASSADPLLQYSRAMEEDILPDLKRRMAVRSRLLDHMDDRTLDGLIGTLSSVQERFDPNLLFDPEEGRRGIWSCIRTMIAGGNAFNAMRYLVPFMLSNYSLGPKRWKREAMAVPKPAFAEAGDPKGTMGYGAGILSDWSRT